MSGKEGTRSAAGLGANELVEAISDLDASCGPGIVSRVKIPPKARGDGSAPEPDNVDVLALSILDSLIGGSGGLSLSLGVPFE